MGYQINGGLWSKNNNETFSQLYTNECRRGSEMSPNVWENDDAF